MGHWGRIPQGSRRRSRRRSDDLRTGPDRQLRSVDLDQPGAQRGGCRVGGSSGNGDARFKAKLRGGTGLQLADALGRRRGAHAADESKRLALGERRVREGRSD